MIEIFPNLYVGGERDLVHALDHDHIDGAEHVKPEWFVVSAAKEPWHRKALGYTGRAAPKDDPEYLIASRPMRLILNLVDVDDPAYIRPEIMDAAFKAITANIGTRKVLVHCNQGLSRSATIGLLYVHQFTDRLPQADFDEGVAFFTGSIYPAYAPAKGMAQYARQHWSDPHGPT